MCASLALLTIFFCAALAIETISVQRHIESAHELHLDPLIARLESAKPSSAAAVEEFRMSQRRIGPGERADGVLVFQRPSFKQSNETLLLQMADSGAVDRPALAPIGFGISSLRQKGAE